MRYFSYCKQPRRSINIVNWKYIQCSVVHQLGVQVATFRGGVSCVGNILIYCVHLPLTREKDTNDLQSQVFYIKYSHVRSFFMFAKDERSLNIQLVVGTVQDLIIPYLEPKVKLKSEKLKRSLSSGCLGLQLNIFYFLCFSSPLNIKRKILFYKN